MLDLIIWAVRAPTHLEPVVQQRIVERTDEVEMHLFDAEATQLLMDTLSELYERGWQPLDFLHVARRSDRRLAQVAALAVLSQAARTNAEQRAPRAWVEQLRVAADVVGDGPDTPSVDASSSPPSPLSPSWGVVDALVGSGVAPSRAWCAVLQLMATFHGHRRLEHLLPPPSAWDRTATPRADADVTDRSRMLNKIRGLLAKAEATTFAAEAEAFTAKAQDLMTRHAIEAAVLHAAGHDPVAVIGARVYLESPYAAEKAQLLNYVALANRVRMVYDRKRAIATVVGTLVDVDQVHLLFTSLLIQATRSMAEAGSSGHAGSSPRSASFRRAFLTAYSVRIGERLTAADREAVNSYGAELVPVLARRDAAVEAEYDRLFPETRVIRSSPVDGRGWEAGRRAADRAVFAAGRLTR